MWFRRAFILSKEIEFGETMPDTALTSLMLRQSCELPGLAQLFSRVCSTSLVGSTPAQHERVKELLLQLLSQFTANARPRGKQHRPVPCPMESNSQEQTSALQFYQRGAQASPEP